MMHEKHWEDHEEELVLEVAWVDLSELQSQDLSEVVEVCLLVLGDICVNMIPSLTLDLIARPRVPQLICQSRWECS